jgi:uncharacterized OB-fold protein
MTAEAKALRPRPVKTRDTQFWWDALKEHRLVIQHCTNCGQLRHPPTPSCPNCWSLLWDTVEASGKASLFTYTVVHKPLVPAFDKPNTVAVVQLEEGTKLVTEIEGIANEDLEIGMPLKLGFLDCDPELTLPVFGPAKESER